MTSTVFEYFFLRMFTMTTIFIVLFCEPHVSQAVPNNIFCVTFIGVGGITRTRLVKLCNVCVEKKQRKQIVSVCTGRG